MEPTNKDDWETDFVKVIDQCIGFGSFGQLYLVRSKKTGKHFAMKEINLRQNVLKTSPINRRYALEEGSKLLAHHPNVITYHGLYTSTSSSSSIYWILDYMDGGSLRDLISIYQKQQQQQHRPRLAEPLIWHVWLQMCDAIAFIHSQGILHRDIKPENVLIENKRGTCKLADFGFAKRVRPLSEYDNNDSEDLHEQQDWSSETTTTKLDEWLNVSQVGSPAYMAPELKYLITAHLAFSSMQTIGDLVRVCQLQRFKMDIFSLGCVLFEMCTRRSPFSNDFQAMNSSTTSTHGSGDDHDELVNYSDDLIDLIGRCLRREPEKRPHINQLLATQAVQTRQAKRGSEYLNAFRMQIIPGLVLDHRSKPLVYHKVKLNKDYKPIAMKTLKFNMNLTLVLVNTSTNNDNEQQFETILKSTLNSLYTSSLAFFKSSLTTNTTTTNHNNNTTEAISLNAEFIYCEKYETNLDQNGFKLLVFNEYGKLIKEFDSFSIGENNVNSRNKRVLFDFKVYDFAVDEQFNHFYLSTRKHGILRFNIVDRGSVNYLDELVFDGRLDLSEFSRDCFPTRLALIENEEHAKFRETVLTSGKRRLVFQDRCSNRLVSIQCDLNHHTKREMIDSNSLESIKMLDDNEGLYSRHRITCAVNSGLTLNKNFIKQMLCTTVNLICLFESNVVCVYNVKTLQLIKEIQFSSASVNFYKQLTCLCCVTATDLSSSSSSLSTSTLFYASNGRSCFQFDAAKISRKWKPPSTMLGEGLIGWMEILANGKLVLLTDSLQMECASLCFLSN